MSKLVKKKKDIPFKVCNVGQFPCGNSQQHVGKMCRIHLLLYSIEDFICPNPSLVDLPLFYRKKKSLSGEETSLRMYLPFGSADQSYFATFVALRFSPIRFQILTFLCNIWGIKVWFKNCMLSMMNKNRRAITADVCASVCENRPVLYHYLEVNLLRHLIKFVTKPIVVNCFTP